MPRKKASHSDQLYAARKKIDAILSKYKGCSETINLGRSIYRKDKVNNCSYKGHFNDYNVLIKAEKLVRELSTCKSSSTANNELPPSLKSTNDALLSSPRSNNILLLPSSSIDINELPLPTANDTPPSLSTKNNAKSMPLSNLNSNCESFYGSGTTVPSQTTTTVSNINIIQESFGMCTKPMAQDPPPNQLS